MYEIKTVFLYIFFSIVGSLCNPYIIFLIISKQNPAYGKEKLMLKNLEMGILVFFFQSS